MLACCWIFSKSPNFNPHSIASWYFDPNCTCTKPPSWPNFDLKCELAKCGFVNIEPLTMKSLVEDRKFPRWRCHSIKSTSWKMYQSYDSSFLEIMSLALSKFSFGKMNRNKSRTLASANFGTSCQLQCPIFARTKINNEKFTYTMYYANAYAKLGTRDVRIN